MEAPGRERARLLPRPFRPRLDRQQGRCAVARRERSKGATVIAADKKQTANSWKDRKSYIAGNGHGWTSNTSLDDGKRSSPAFDEYRRVLAEKVGPDQAQQILRPRYLR
jgi:hypothetical protein